MTEPDALFAGISPELAAVIDMVRASGLTDETKPLDERAKILDIDLPAPEGTDVEVLDKAVTGFAGEWIVAPGAATDRAVVHFHGGAYTSGGPGSHRPFAAALSKGAGCAVLLVDYRLAPAHPFPAALDDAQAALDWLTADTGRNLRADQVVVSGDSAGGGLAAALLVARRDAGAAQPAGAVLLSPWTDLALTGASFDTQDGLDPMCSRESLGHSAAAYVPAGIARTDPRVSPLYADLAGLAPLLIHVGEIEVLRDDAVEFADRARAAGTEVELYIGPGMIHVWHLFADIAPESTRDLALVTDWIRSRLA